MGARISFYRAEKIAFGMIAAVVLLDLWLAQAKGIRIDLASFLPNLIAGFGLIALSSFYRLRGRAPQMTLGAMSCAMLILFTNAGTVLNLLLITPGAAPIDPALMRMDAALGFDWRRFAEALAQVPLINPVLWATYSATLGQLAVMILILGFSNRQMMLHRFLLVGMISSCIAIAVWSLVPSFGPSPLVPLDPATDAALGRAVDAAYAARMVELNSIGITTITQASLIGLIAFPSMHTVMALMSVYFARTTFAFWPMAVIGVLMIPAIIIHGGHHLVDLIAGAATFCVALWLAGRLVPAPETLPGAQSAAERPGEPLPA